MWWSISRNGNSTCTGCCLMHSMSSWLPFLTCPGPQEAHLCWLRRQVTLRAWLLPMMNDSRFEREDEHFLCCLVTAACPSSSEATAHGRWPSLPTTFSHAPRLSLSSLFLFLPVTLFYFFRCRGDKGASLLDPRYSTILVVSQHILYTIALSSPSLSCQDPASNTLLIHNQ